MLDVIGILVIGIVVGRLISAKAAILGSVEKASTIAIYILLFLLGASVGVNELVIKNLYTLGVQGLWLSIGGVAGSVVIAYWLYHRIFKKDLEELPPSDSGFLVPTGQSSADSCVASGEVGMPREVHTVREG